MVLKSSKSGVYSGNTLRASNSRYSRQYRKHSFIVRRLVADKEKAKHYGKTSLDKFNISSFDLAFSLNKRERWGLPEAIIQDLQAENDEGETKTDLLVKHKLKRSANCVAYYANKGQLTRCVARKGRYFDGKGVTNFKTKQNKLPRQPDNVEETKPEETPEPTVRYEVFYPCSKFSSITHNPKYITPDTDGNGEATEFSSKVVKGRQKAQRSRLTSRDIDELLEYCDPRDDENCDFSGPGKENAPDNISQRSNGHFTIQDFLKTEQNPKKRTRRRRRSHNADTTDTKTRRIVYMEPAKTTQDGQESEQTTVAAELGPTRFSPVTTMYPVRVKIPKSETEAERLEEAYGNSYLEASCQPRRFSIDLSEKVKRHVKTLKTFRDVTVCSFDLHTFITFTEIGCVAEPLTYDVCLNISSTMNSVKIDTLLEMDTYTLEELEAKVLDFVSCLPREVFVKKDQQMIPVERLLTFDLINKTNNWHVSCIHPLTTFDTMDYDVDAPTADSCGTNKDSPSSEFCNICFTEIRTTSETGAEGDSATCLSRCSHWFCDVCWREHLCNMVRAGSLKLSCPEYKCKTEIDIAFLLPFLPITEIKKYYLRREGEKVNCSSQAKWCPKPQCGHVLLTEGKNSSSLNMMCRCGTDLCFTCMKNAHWPASCKQANLFREKVIALKDYTNLPKDLFLDPLPDAVLVDGKSCPRCKRFIEKVSGCPTMTCPCSASFCWNCLKVLPPYARHDCDPKALKKVLLEEDEHQMQGMKRTGFYDSALEHRKHRLQLATCRLRSRGFNMAKRLVSKTAKDRSITKDILALPTEGDTALKRTCKYMTSIVGLKLELHHVTEHTAILLDNTPPGAAKARLLPVLEALESLTCQLTVIFESGVEQNLTCILGKLQNIERRAQSVVRTLSNVVSATHSC